MGFSDLCCGKPLDSIGLTAEADRYLDRLRQQLKDSGARKVITACPNCEAHLKAYLPGSKSNPFTYCCCRPASGWKARPG